MIDFSKVHIPYNYVLVKELRKNDELLLRSGHKLYLDTSYEKEKHASVYGLVVKVPEKLYFDKESHSTKSVYYDVDIELKSGDIGFFNYMCVQNCIDNNAFLLDGEDVYFFIKYDLFICAKRGDDVIPVNGFVIVEALENENIKRLEAIGLVAPDGNQDSERRGIVKYIGSPVRNYFYENEGTCDTNEIKQGNTVLFGINDSIALEYDIHRILSQGRQWYKMRRNDILGIFN